MQLGGLNMSSPNPLEHIRQHTLLKEEVHLGGLTLDFTLVSNLTIMLLVAGVLLVLLFPRLVRQRQGTDEVGRLVASGFGNFIETICEYLRDNVARPALGEHTDRFIKFIWSVFFFILTVNLLGLVPLGSVTPLFGLHVGGTATGNIWVTGTMALITLGMIVVNGLRIGGRHYLAHFNPGPPWLAPLMVPLEIFGLLAKAFALAVRLFANMIAGHILLAVLVSFILMAGSAMGAVGGILVAVPVIAGSIAITMLEIFVAFLQAYIFTFLTALFIGMAVVFHHEEHGKGAAHSH